MSKKFLVILMLVTLLFITVVPTHATDTISIIGDSITEPSEFLNRKAVALANGYYVAIVGVLPNNVCMYQWKPKCGSAYIYEWDANSKQWVFLKLIGNLVKGAEEPKSIYQLNYITW